MKLLHTTLGPICTNCYFVVDDDNNTTIIDPGANPARVNQLLEENNLTPKAILLTHGHFDHTGAVMGIKKKHPQVKAYIGEKDAPMLPKTMENSNWKSHITKEDYEGLTADILVHDGDEIVVGELKFKAIETPGHTRGGMCYICEDCIFSGDTLFRHECGRCDLDGGDFSVMLHSLKRLYDLEGNYNVLPGHDELTTLDEERKNNRYMKEALK